MTDKLFEWQQKAINAFFKFKKSLILEVCTGAGKTFVAIEIIKKILNKNKNTKCLIVVPKNVILEMWANELAKVFSFNKVGIYYSEYKEPSQITVTNLQNIKKLNFNDFDFLIVDELHNFGTENLLKLLNHNFEYKLGLTATLETNEHNLKIISKFNAIYEYEMKEALEDNILNKFDFYNVGIILDENTRLEYNEISDYITKLMQSCGGYKNIMTNPVMLQKKLLIQKKFQERQKIIFNYKKKIDVVINFCEMFKNKKILIFNQYNLQTNKTKFELGIAGMKSVAVHSNLNKKDVKQNLTDFEEGKRNILVTTRMLDEGWNLRNIDVGIIMAGNSTNKQTIQRLGRVLRKKENNSILIQLYCKNTIEETYTKKRIKLFKELCETFTELEM